MSLNPFANISGKETKRMVRIVNIKDEKERWLGDGNLVDWVIETLGDIRFKPPPTPPEEWRDYKDLPRGQQLAMLDNSAFWQSEPIKKYMDSVSMAENTNKSNIKWLEEVLSHMEPLDPRRHKIEEKLRILQFETTGSASAPDVAWED